ncbi:MAG: hypothetical protein ABFC75_01870 [Rectinema sp.]
MTGRIGLTVSRILIMAAILLAIAGGSVAASEPSQPSVKPGEMTVQVRQAAVRGEPSALSAPLSMLAYGDVVYVTGSVDGWALLRLSGREKPAYMYLSSLTPKRIGGSGPMQTAVPGVSAPELALAGKGFDSRIEKNYGAKTHLDFRYVDLMEEFRFDPERCAAFLNGGE